jgi:hypothetical protein
MNRWTYIGMTAAVATMMAGTTFAQEKAPFPEAQPPGAKQAPAEKIEPRDRPPRAEAPMPRAPDAKGAPENGVIHPPATGDRSVIPAPNQNRASTPELRPPGTPGGNPNVQPR